MGFHGFHTMTSNVLERYILHSLFQFEVGFFLPSFIPFQYTFFLLFFQSLGNYVKTFMDHALLLE
jgi:hypothetical protein